MRLKTTKQHERYWKNRQIDWQKQYFDTWNHPHRQLIVWALESISNQWLSLWEAGCGPGANLARIVKEGTENPRLANKQLGGSDINAAAIELARKNFKGGRFHVEPIDDMLLSDDSVDVVLTDAALIYYGPQKIDKAIHEITRIARNYVVLCEFHSTSLWERLKLRYKTGYNAYDYQTLLEKHGCHSIKIVKIPPQFWDGYPWQPFGHLIIARVTKI